VYDARKGKKFFLRRYDWVSDDEGVAWVLRGEVKVWNFRFSRSENAVLK